MANDEWTRFLLVTVTEIHFGIFIRQKVQRHKRIGCVGDELKIRLRKIKRNPRTRFGSIRTYSFHFISFHWHLISSFEFILDSKSYAINFKLISTKVSSLFLWDKLVQLTPTAYLKVIEIQNEEYPSKHAKILNKISSIRSNFKLK